MASVRHSRLLRFTGLLLSALVWLANNSNPPTGRTGAPFDGNCSDCHNGSNPGGFDGDVTVTGLPATIQANTVYPLVITMTPTAGNPIKGGFQLVVVDGNNTNAGNLAAGNAQSGTEFFSTREYLEHRGGKTFSGNPISWNFNWTSPLNGVAGNTIKVYYIGNFTNNNNNDTGDFTKSFLDTYAFEGPPPVTASIISSTNVLCAGGTTGSATAEGAGGVAPYTYHWSNNQNTATASNLIAGTYTVTVTGASSSGTATASVTITQPPVLTLSASSSGILTCLQTTVTGTATAGGGTPGYDFSWSNGETGNIAEFTEPGSYTVTVTDANGCTKVSGVTVTQNIVQPNAVAAPAPTITCSTPQVTLSGAGSSQGPGISYLWTTNDGNIVSGSTTLSPVVNACGTYVLKVTNNANGCTATASTFVNCEIDPPNISASNNGPLTCSLLNVTLSGASTTPGVTYSWSGPNGFSSSLPNPSTNSPGVYTLVVSNPGNNCSSSATSVVSQNIAVPTDTAHVSGVITCAIDSVQIFITTNIQNATYSWTGPNGFTSTQKKDTIDVPGNYIGVVTNPVNGCKGRDTITVMQNITAPGATAAVSGPINCNTPIVQLLGSPSGQNNYAWSGPNNFSANQQNTSTNIAGPYTLLVTSQINACTSSSTVTVLPNTTPPAVSIATPGHLNCQNATIQLNATASSQGANFVYLWSTINGNIVSGDNTLTPIVNEAGTYTLTVIDVANGCTAASSTQVIQSPALNAAISSSVNVSCNGGANGSAMAVPSGGNGPYTFAWSSGATTSTISGLTAGAYVVSITDAENCTATATVVITQPEVLQANATATGETALGAGNGTASASPSGGTPAYTYIWSNNTTTAFIGNLQAGSYTVTVADANGCTVVQTVTVNAFGCALSASISATNVTCSGADNGTATVALSGAANPVTFVWSNGATTESVSGLAPGTYTVSIVDDNNCPAILNTSISEPTPVAANASSTNETANGAQDGTASATPTGGTGAYTYLWSNSTTTSTISGLVSGTYTVTVSDANNCTAVQSVTVSAFNCAITATITGANVSCFGGNNGLATVSLSGGQLPYTYVWSNGATTATAGNLEAGIYTVNVTDAAGCLVTESTVISQPLALNAEALNIQNVVCPSDLTGSVSIDASGGVPPYSFTGSMSNLGAGAHTVVVTDANGCTKIVTFNIIATDNVPPVVSCPGNIILCGADFVTYPPATATDNCGTTGAPVLISGLPSGAAFNDGTTVQVFRATDATGNSATCSFSITVFPVPDILVDGSVDDHNGQGSGSISVTPIGGSGSYLYLWKKNGQIFATTEDLTGLFAGSYTLTITDGNGCSSALAPIVINNTVGAFEPDGTGSVRLYPNPVLSSFQLVITDLDVVAAHILDTRGRLVYELKPQEWNGAVPLNNIPTGVYFLKISTQSGRVLTLKFVKTE